MNAVTQLKQSDLPERFAPFGGGFYIGLLMIQGQLHALVVSPKADGEFEGKAWGEYGKDVEGATSFFDGLANTDAMAEAGSEIAQTVRALRIGGHDDWHIPARDQLELLYRHCKPTTEENWVYRHGDNPSSVPPGYPYQETIPAQSLSPLFAEGGEQAFADAWYWSSTQSSAHDAWFQDFDDGYQYGLLKDLVGRVRAVRTIPLQ